MIEFDNFIFILKGMFKSAIEVNAKRIKMILDVSALKFMILSVVLTDPLTAMNVKPIAGRFTCPCSFRLQWILLAKFCNHLCHD